MAEFPNKNEEMLIEALLPTEVCYWIGLNDLAIEGTFRWVESHQEPSYDNWGSGQPSNTDNQDCVVKQCLIGQHCQWNDYQCGWAHYSGFPHFALCQKSKS